MWAGEQRRVDQVYSWGRHVRVVSTIRFEGLCGGERFVGLALPLPFSPQP